MSAPLDAARPHKRKGFWYLIRRVPREFEAFDERGLVMLSTGIRIVDDPLAREAVLKLEEGLERYWRDLRAGRDPEAQARYERAREAARRVGVAYLPARDVAALPVADLVRRIETLESRGGR